MGTFLEGNPIEKCFCLRVPFNPFNDGPYSEPPTNPLNLARQLKAESCISPYFCSVARVLVVLVRLHRVYDNLLAYLKHVTITGPY